ncbi:hypothetical protein JB92DRAFT_2941736 [Gautieria morchelliformis]|nr:hypothetical protein JB92DRAFT_2941736 [Gautieria morchelliformis]
MAPKQIKTSNLLRFHYIDYIALVDWMCQVYIVPMAMTRTFGGSYKIFFVRSTFMLILCGMYRN